MRSSLNSFPIHIQMTFLPKFLAKREQMKSYDVPRAPWETVEEDPISEIVYDDNSFKNTISRQIFLQDFQECESYKVSVTFHRKHWKKARAFKHAYVKLKEILDSCDVESGMFFMELHESGFPHFHGIVKWEKGYESPDFLRNRLVQVYGQTKLFKYDPQHFLEKEEKTGVKNKCETWYDYISKDYITMLQYKQDTELEFNVYCKYDRIAYGGKYIYNDSQYI